MIKNKIIIFCSLLVLFFTCHNHALAEKNVYEIQAEKVQYKDGNSLIIAEGNAYAFDNNGKEIYADKILYYKNKSIIKSIGNSKYKDATNILEANEFHYDISSEIIEAKKNVILTDKENNKFYFEQFIYNEKSQQGEADKLRANLYDGSYLKSKSAKIDNKNSILSLDEAVYTTCSKINNKNGEYCPSWSIKSKKVIHDKKKQRITHKNAFLRLKNIPVFYTPYISHPDPTVKRQSGFLPPMIKTNSNVGRTFRAPYFWAISEDKDLTITPVYFFDERHMVQTSFRQDTKNGFLKIENGFTEGYKNLNKTGRTGGSRNYIFADYNGIKDNVIFKNNEIKLKIQRISQQNFTRVNKINTVLFKEDQRNLENSLQITSYEGSKRLVLRTGVFENLNVSNNNKYSYHLPDGSYSYNTKKIEDFNTNINSYFIGKKFSNDQKQFKVRNLISLNSNQFTNNNSGITTSLKASVYNNNIYNENVTGLKENTNIDNYFTFGADTTYPLAKIEKYSYQTFSPRLFVKYTSGKMQNASGNNKILNYSDIFSLNRTNNLDAPETGVSLGHGVNYTFSKTDLDYKNKYKINMGIGQVVRKSRLDKMPTKSSLNNKSSDFAGFANYQIFGEEVNKSIKNEDNLSYLSYFNKNNLNVTYNFNLDNDLTSLNRNDLGINGTYKSYYAKLDFNEKNNHAGNERNSVVNIKKLFYDNYYISYEGKKNLLTNSSEYHKMAINFENDCLVTSLALSRDFYSDKDLKASKTLIFNVLIKPFSDNFAPDLTDFIN